MDEYPPEHDSQQDDLPPDRVEAAIGLARQFSFVATGGLIASALLTGPVEPSVPGSAVPAFAMVAFAVAVTSALLVHGDAVQIRQFVPASLRASRSANFNLSWVALLTGLVLLCISALMVVG